MSSYSKRSLKGQFNRAFREFGKTILDSLFRTASATKRSSRLPMAATLRCPACDAQVHLTEGPASFTCAHCSAHIASPFAYLFVDSETTGLPHNGVQPHLVQLGWALYNALGEPLREHCHIVRPQGWIIPAEAAAIHGISTAEALEKGEPRAEVLAGLAYDLSRPYIRLVAHNLSFDRGVIAAEFSREGIPHNLFDLPSCCTMRSTTSLCRLPGYYGGYKWPKLKELHAFIFGREFSGAHNALEDVRATARCFFALYAQGLILGS